jgi:hypothetical protein
VNGIYAGQNALQPELTPGIFTPPAEGFSRPNPCGDTPASRYIVCLDEHPVAAKAQRRNTLAD